MKSVPKLTMEIVIDLLLIQRGGSIESFLDVTLAERNGNSNNEIKILGTA